MTHLGEPSDAVLRDTGYDRSTVGGGDRIRCDVGAGTCARADPRGHAALDAILRRLHRPARIQRPSLAQRAMNSPMVAAIYQDIWRPIMVAVMSLHGMSIAAEPKRASAALHLGGRQRVLNVT